MGRTVVSQLARARPLRQQQRRPTAKFCRTLLGCCERGKYDFLYEFNLTGKGVCFRYSYRSVYLTGSARILMLYFILQEFPRSGGPEILMETNAVCKWHSNHAACF